MKTVMVLVVGLLAVANVDSAYAQTHFTRYYSGQLCQSRSGSDAATFQRDEVGFYNGHATLSKNLLCTGMWIDEGLELWGDSGRVAFDDQSDDANAAGAISCAMFITDEDGDTLTSSVRYGCSTGGGCASVPATFTGTGIIDFTTAIEGLNDVEWSVGFACTLPPADGAGDTLYSYIAGYRIETHSEGP